MCVTAERLLGDDVRMRSRNDDVFCATRVGSPTICDKPKSEQMEMNRLASADKGLEKGLACDQTMLGKLKSPKSIISVPGKRMVMLFKQSHKSSQKDESLDGDR